MLFPLEKNVLEGKEIAAIQYSLIKCYLNLKRFFFLAFFSANLEKKQTSFINAMKENNILWQIYSL